MTQHPVIKQILAALLLMVFTLSIAPKKFLHDAIANHKDKTIVVAAGENAQLTHSGFICKCDNLVAESPFTNEVTQFDFTQPKVFSVQKALPLYHFYSVDHFFFELRGPPAGCTMI